MSVERLQEKIRKLKSPLACTLDFNKQTVPASVLESAGSATDGYIQYCKQLFEALKDSVAAIRFQFNAFVLHGADGVYALELLCNCAKEHGYYVFMDIAEPLSAQAAQQTADYLFSEDCKWYFDGLITTAYTGSDCIRPFAEKLKENKKTLFVVARTANRSAAEIQDLLTGSRLVHVAKTDIVNRFAETMVGKTGYSQIGVVASASSADSLRTLRNKYQNMFFLLDGYDYPNANAKNCSYAFDKLGHGAIACVGSSVVDAWQMDDHTDYISQAVAEAERLKKNLTRYVTIL